MDKDYDTGLFYLKLKKYDEALKYFEIAADNGHADAQFKMWVFRKFNLGNIHWLQRAAEQGHHEASIQYHKFIYSIQNGR